MIKNRLSYTANYKKLILGISNTPTRIRRQRDTAR